MYATEQTQAQEAAQQAAIDAQHAAAQAAAKAQALQLQKQIEKTVNEAMNSGKLSNDTKQELKDQIKESIQAAREAVQETSDQPPLPPGLSSSRGESRNNDIPPQVPEIMSIMGVTLVCCVVGFPLARAFARWIDRRGTTAPAASKEVVQRLAAIEQAVESVAVEVERISEGQRFTTRVLSEGAHNASPDVVQSREPVPVGTPANARRS